MILLSDNDYLDFCLCELNYTRLTWIRSYSKWVFLTCALGHMLNIQKYYGTHEKGHTKVHLYVIFIYFLLCLTCALRHMLEKPIKIDFTIHCIQFLSCIVRLKGMAGSFSLYT